MVSSGSRCLPDLVTIKTKIVESYFNESRNRVQTLWMLDFVGNHS